MTEAAYEPSDEDYVITVFSEDVRSFPPEGDFGPVKALICLRCGALVSLWEVHDRWHATSDSADDRPDDG